MGRGAQLLHVLMRVLGGARVPRRALVCLLAVWGRSKQLRQSCAVILQQLLGSAPLTNSQEQLFLRLVLDKCPAVRASAATKCFTIIDSTSLHFKAGRHGSSGVADVFVKGNSDTTVTRTASGGGGSPDKLNFAFDASSGGWPGKAETTGVELERREQAALEAGNARSVGKRQERWLSQFSHFTCYTVQVDLVIDSACVQCPARDTTQSGSRYADRIPRCTLETQSQPSVLSKTA